MKLGVPIHRRNRPSSSIPRIEKQTSVEVLADNSVDRLLSQDQEERRQKLIDKISKKKHRQELEEIPHEQIQDNDSTLIQPSPAQALTLEVDEDELARKRRVLRARLKAQTEEVNLGLQVEPSNLLKAFPQPACPLQEQVREEDEEDDDEEDEDEEEEEVLPMPKFVSKQDREALLATKSAQEEAENISVKRKAQTRRLLQNVLLEERIREDIAEEQHVSSNVYGLRPDRPDDTDGKDEEAEFEAWRIRELKRLEKEESIA